MSTFEWPLAYDGCTSKPAAGVAISWPIVCLEVAEWVRSGKCETDIQMTSSARPFQAASCGQFAGIEDQHSPDRLITPARRPQPARRQDTQAPDPRRCPGLDTVAMRTVLHTVMSLSYPGD